MNNPFKIAKKVLLEPTGLTEHELEKVLGKALGPGIDFADIYLHYSQSESWVLDENIVKKGSFLVDQGFGIRAVSGENTGHAFADDLALSTLTQAATAAQKIASSGKSYNAKVWEHVKFKRLYQSINPLESIPEEEKISLLEKANAAARSADPRVSQVRVDLAGSYKVFLVAANDGVIAADVLPLVRLNISVLVEQNGKRDRGSSGGGGRSGYQFIVDQDLATKYAREAVRIALVNLEAIPTPAGTMPVVLGPGWPAVMLHEAVGHGLEADFNRKKYSIYSDKIGKQVASKLCTVIDQGNLPGERRGSINVDDEGTPTGRTVLIEDGILCGYMYDKLNARLLKTKSTGNGRRSSYAQIPLPRMTNTFLMPGASDPKEIIASVKNGIYAVNFSGGEVDITSGEFVFSTSEAYLIENGRVTAPVRGATLIGNGPDVLNKITMVGNDLAMDDGVGTCGKNGQDVPVGVGQPTVKISNLTVGGTEAGEDM
ncbi:MAG: metalloprotease TldD [Gammaproteobacteria bacterium]|nr:metalloprotease TldD [Gammaproteobacteria bacterium]